MTMRTLLSSLLRGINFLSDTLESMMPPLEPTSGLRPAPKPYRRPGPDIGMWFAMLLGGVVVWGIVIVLLAHFW